MTECRSTAPFVDRVPHAVSEALGDPARVCPLLAGPSLLKGRRLRVRLDENELRVDAPARYLEALFDRCDGRTSVDELSLWARTRWRGDEHFGRFIEDMLGSGVLVDASSILVNASRTAANPTSFGRPAAPAVWKQGVVRLPPRVNDDTALPAPRDSGLLALLGCRRSAQRFGPELTSERDIALLLRAAYGFGAFDKAIDSAGVRRTVASAGGFYGLRLFLILVRSTGRWERGVYRVVYANDGGIGLEELRGSIEELPRAFVDPSLLRNATGVIVVANDLDPASLKYLNKAYPYALIECGAVLQNLSLAAAASETALRIVGGIEDDRLTRLSNIEGAQILASVVFGATTGSPERSESPALTFEWWNDLRDLPFHLGRASIKLGSIQVENAWGRDTDPSRAYDKAVGEAVERLAFRLPRACMPSRFDALDHAIDPRSIAAYTPSQHRSRGFPFKRFDPTAEYLWVPVTELGTDRRAWTVAESVFHGGYLPATYRDRVCMRASSSGCASGRTVADALERAVLELIERDAFMRHWCAQRGGLLIETSSLPTDAIARVHRLEREGCRVLVQCLPGACPTLLIFVQHERRRFTAVGSASGRHALAAALSEVEMSAYVRLSAPPPDEISPREVKSPEDHARLYVQSRHFRRADALQKTSSTIDFAEFIKQADFPALEALAARNTSVFYADISIEGAPTALDGHTIHTVKAIISGLLPIAFGYGLMPLGLLPKLSGAARFPHPFP